MGRKSRRKWEHRRRRPLLFDRPLETRWGTHPLARAFGGMLQGLGVGMLVAVLALLVGLGRMLRADALPEAISPADGLSPVIGGWLLGGAVAGALAPLRDRIGGRRAQGIAMAAVMLLVWMPILNAEARLDVAGAAVLWILFSVIFGLMFARLFAILDPVPLPAQIQELDPDFRSGRRHRFR